MGDRTRGIRWLIDGMNVIGSKPDRWWNDPDKAMRNMTVLLDRYADAAGDDLTVVYDKRPADLDMPSRVAVVFARRKGRNAADHEIETIVAADPHPETLTVVTSDKRLIDRVRALGAQVVSSGRFRRRLEEVVGA